MKRSCETALGFSVLGLARLSGCSNSGRLSGPDTAATQGRLVLSNPVPNAETKTFARQAFSSGTIVSFAAAAEESDLTYVSLASGTYPDWTLGVVRTPRIDVTLIVLGGGDARRFGLAEVLPPWSQIVGALVLMACGDGATEPNDGRGVAQSSDRRPFLLGWFALVGGH
jgi:hypothetical protein